MSKITEIIHEDVYQYALKRIWELWGATTKSEEDELDFLCTLVEKFEEQFGNDKK